MSLEKVEEGRLELEDEVRRPGAASRSEEGFEVGSRTSVASPDVTHRGSSTSACSSDSEAGEGSAAAKNISQLSSTREVTYEHLRLVNLQVHQHLNALNHLNSLSEDAAAQRQARGVDAETPFGSNSPFLEGLHPSLWSDLFCSGDDQRFEAGRHADPGPTEPGGERESAAAREQGGAVEQSPQEGLPEASQGLEAEECKTRSLSFADACFQVMDCCEAKSAPATPSHEGPADKPGSKKDLAVSATAERPTDLCISAEENHDVSVQLPDWDALVAHSLSRRASPELDALPKNLREVVECPLTVPVRGLSGQLNGLFKNLGFTAGPQQPEERRVNRQVLEEPSQAAQVPRCKPPSRLTCEPSPPLGKAFCEQSADTPPKHKPRPAALSLAQPTFPRSPPALDSPSPRTPRQTETGESVPPSPATFSKGPSSRENRERAEEQEAELAFRRPSWPPPRSDGDSKAAQSPTEEETASVSSALVEGLKASWRVPARRDLEAPEREAAVVAFQCRDTRATPASPAGPLPLFLKRPTSTRDKPLRPRLTQLELDVQGPARLLASLREASAGSAQGPAAQVCEEASQPRRRVSVDLAEAERASALEVQSRPWASEVDRDRCEEEPSAKKESHQEQAPPQPEFKNAASTSRTSAVCRGNSNSSNSDSSDAQAAAKGLCQNEHSDNYLPDFRKDALAEETEFAVSGGAFFSAMELSANSDVKEKALDCPSFGTLSVGSGEDNVHVHRRVFATEEQDVRASVEEESGGTRPSSPPPRLGAQETLGFERELQIGESREFGRNVSWESAESPPWRLPTFGRFPEEKEADVESPPSCESQDCPAAFPPGLPSSGTEVPLFSRGGVSSLPVFWAQKNAPCADGWRAAEPSFTRNAEPAVSHSQPKPQQQQQVFDLCKPDLGQGRGVSCSVFPGQTLQQPPSTAREGVVREPRLLGSALLLDEGLGSVSLQGRKGSQSSQSLPSCGLARSPALSDVRTAAHASVSVSRFGESPSPLLPGVTGLPGERIASASFVSAPAESLRNSPWRAPPCCVSASELPQLEGVQAASSSLSPSRTSVGFSFPAKAFFSGSSSAGAVLLPCGVSASAAASSVGPSFARLEQKPSASQPRLKPVGPFPLRANVAFKPTVRRTRDRERGPSKSPPPPQRGSGIEDLENQDSRKKALWMGSAECSSSSPLSACPSRRLFLGGTRRLFGGRKVHQPTELSPRRFVCDVKTAPPATPRRSSIFLAPQGWPQQQQGDSSLGSFSVSSCPCHCRPCTPGVFAQRGEEGTPASTCPFSSPHHHQQQHSSTCCSASAGRRERSGSPPRCVAREVAALTGQAVRAVGASLAFKLGKFVCALGSALAEEAAELLRAPDSVETETLNTPQREQLLWTASETVLHSTQASLTRPSSPNARLPSLTAGDCLAIAENFREREERAAPEDGGGEEDLTLGREKALQAAQNGEPLRQVQEEERESKGEGSAPGREILSSGEKNADLSLATPKSNDETAAPQKLPLPLLELEFDIPAEFTQDEEEEEEVREASRRLSARCLGLGSIVMTQRMHSARRKSSKASFMRSSGMECVM